MKKYYHLRTGQFGYPQPENSYRSITYSSTVGCQTCDVGKKQISEFRFRAAPKPLKNHITGLNWVFDEVFIRGIVKVIFENSGLTGLDFSEPVFNKSSEIIPEFYQLKVDRILPAALLNSDLGIELCEYPKNEEMIKFLEGLGSKLVEGPFCGHMKFNLPQGQTLTFKKEIFEDQLDFVRTNEWFGSGASANRLILVSENVKELIEQNMFKGCFFEPIDLI